MRERAQATVFLGAIENVDQWTLDRGRLVHPSQATFSRSATLWNIPKRFHGQRRKYGLKFEDVYFRPALISKGDLDPAVYERRN